MTRRDKKQKNRYLWLKWRRSKEFDGLERGKLVLPPPMNVKGLAATSDAVFDLNKPPLPLPLASVAEIEKPRPALGFAIGL